jgi:hypothetical protein
MPNLIAMPTPAALPPPVEPWVDTAAVAAHIGFSYQQTAKMAKEGLIPGWPRKSGKKTYWRFKLSVVDEWIKSGQAERVG